MKKKKYAYVVYSGSQIEPWVEGRFKTKRSAQIRIRRLEKIGIRAGVVKEKLKKVMK